MATKRQPSKRLARNARTVRVLDVLLRVSQRKGREGEAFHSPVVQRKACTDWCKLNGARVGRVFDESDSVSGGTIEGRALLGEAMERALSGKSDGIIVMAVDRFGRNLIEGMDAVKRLQASGASFVAVNQGIDTGSTNEQTQSMTNFLLGLMFLLAQRERESLIEKWDVTRERQIEELGIANHETFGYRKGTDEHGRERKLVPVEDEAPAVVEMFERRAAGEGWGAIADALNAAGVLTRTGGKWTHARVRDVINRRTYLGEVASGHDYVNPNAHEAIITQDLWDRAHARDGKRRTTTGATRTDAFLNIGIARCTSCGGAMGPHFSSGGRGERYRCHINFGWGKCTAPASIARAELDAHVEEMFLTDVLALEHELRASDATTALDAARAARDAAKASLRSWTTDPHNDALRIGAPEEYEEGTHARLARLAAAEEQVKREESTAGVRATLPTNLVEVWPTLSNAEKRTWLSTYYGVIAVKPIEHGEGKRVDSRKRVTVFTVDDPALPGGFVIKSDRGGRVAVFNPILVP
jgi:DNA invertase Pin-like site-specific DNA recombinase